MIVHGDFLPRHIFNRFFILCSTIRALFLSFVFSVFYGSYDVVVCDTNSAYMPLIKLLTKSKIFFYCHMPDQVLCIRTSLIKKLYAFLWRRRLQGVDIEFHSICLKNSLCVLQMRFVWTATTLRADTTSVSATSLWFQRLLSCTPAWISRRSLIQSIWLLPLPFLEFLRKFRGLWRARRVISSLWTDTRGRRP